MLNKPSPDCNPPIQNSGETRKRKIDSDQRKWDAPVSGRRVGGDTVGLTKAAPSATGSPAGQKGGRPQTPSRHREETARRRRSTPAQLGTGGSVPEGRIASCQICTEIALLCAIDARSECFPLGRSYPDDDANAHIPASGSARIYSYHFNL